MPINLPKPVTEVRAQLQRFTDDAFNAFCQDYFPEIYLKFSNGMLSSEKVTLLIDYYLRSEEYRLRLVRVLFEEIDLNHTSDTKPERHAYMLAEIHHFDLIELSKACVDAYFESSGPLVILLHSTLHQLLNCLRLRIISDLGEEMFHDDLPEPFPISYKNINEEQRFLLKCKHLLVDYALLRVYIVEDQTALDQIWQTIMHTFIEHTGYRLIVLIGVNNTCTAPSAEMLRLEPPRFKKGDIRLWLKQVSKNRRLKREFVELWEQMIWEDFYPRGEFDMTRAYQHLDFTTKLLGASNFDENKFYLRLEERRKLYG